MITVRGIYEDGVVKLLENPPVSNNQKVLVTFIKETEEEVIRKITFSQYSEWFRNYLEDPNEDLYQDYLNTGNREEHSSLC